MAKQKELKFKPYVGNFFRFNRKNPDVGTGVYSNYLQGRHSKQIEELPESFLVVDEKRNFIRFLSDQGGSLWTRKTHVEPLDLPTYDGNPLPLLKQIQNFLVYCTETKLKDFSVEEMSGRAMELIPLVNSLIETFKADILPKEKK